MSVRTTACLSSEHVHYVYGHCTLRGEIVAEGLGWGWDLLMDKTNFAFFLPVAR